MTTGHIGVIVAVLGGALGQLLMKSGMLTLPYGNFGSVLRSLSFHPASALLIIAGIFSYAVSMIVWVHTLKNHELSKAYPVLSLGYVAVYLAAAFWPGLNESLTMQKTLGISLIIFGVWFAHSSAPAEDT